MSSPSISVVICAFSDERRAELLAAIESVRRQTLAPAQIVVVVDHNPGLAEAVATASPDVLVAANEQTRGLSGARNTGVALATARVVAFLDDDAVAEPDWLANLTAPYADPTVAGVGGAIRPWWSGARPNWFPDEFGWVFGCSYRGLPEAPSEVRNMIGANMSFDRAALLTAGGFRSELGRVGARLLGCEETELCIRLRQGWPARRLLYEPRAVVRHRVTVGRATWRYFQARCYAEGLSKARMTRLVGRRDGLASERAYTLRTLPSGLARGLADSLRGDPSGLGRAGAIVAGLAFTTAGYARGALPSSAARPRQPRPATG
jgi:GT2 family glycosyltransferase